MNTGRSATCQKEDRPAAQLTSRPGLIPSVPNQTSPPLTARSPMFANTGYRRLGNPCCVWARNCVIHGTFEIPLVPKGLELTTTYGHVSN